ncbi:MAG: hypothetical protein NT154_41080, partial [Verrucomicrobia bacterium]|nr:hypothetical protein [Verrucomicrobiota bacterium]
RGKEVHQIGKGDDPSGWVRNDLDNTVRSCESCHQEGTLGAPIAKHSWLPPLHMEKIACVTCHIPKRYTKAALVQASDVFNAAPRITPPPKRIWTFYDQDMTFWNHYGELDLFTVKDQPVDEFRPTVARYKGKIFPVDRVHSAWVGFEEQGKPGLNQLFMKDFYAMWLKHKNDPSKFPKLSLIRDDNGDGMPEVNRPEEIDALLASTAEFLKATSFPMQGRRLVYVNDDRVYYSGTDVHEIAKESHEATPYASVYKYSHNVLPARAALGANGCIDCHSRKAGFFFGRFLDRPFAESGRSSWLPNYQLLGLSSFGVQVGAFREQWLKPALYLLLAFLALLLLILGVQGVAAGQRPLSRLHEARLWRWLPLAGLAGLGIVAATPGLLVYMTVERFRLDANHFWVALAVLTISIWSASFASARQQKILYALVVLTSVSGVLMLLRFAWIDTLNRLSYTSFDLGLTALAAMTSVVVATRLWRSGVQAGA